MAINKKSLENLRPRVAPDRPGDGRSVGIWLRTDQINALDTLEGGRAFHVRKALDAYLGTVSQNPPTPAAPDSPPQVDVTELVQELSYILTMHGIPQRARQAIKNLIGRLQSSQGRLPLG
jgi:hypothetical protein